MIELNDTAASVIAKMSEGNPGAISVLDRLYKESNKIDLSDLFGGFGAIMFLDSLCIYGSRIWMLYKDVCGEDLVKTLAVLRAWQLGFVRESAIHHAIGHYGDGIDANELLKKVMERLPNFNKKEVPVGQDSSRPD
jgi:hypothetical protein